MIRPPWFSWFVAAYAAAGDFDAAAAFAWRMIARLGAGATADPPDTETAR